MLLTGFDAPIEQVMYLDKVIVAHNLLQAIARVNRVDNDDKDVGFIVDYVGVGHHLKSLGYLLWKEQQEILSCITDPTELFKELDTTYKEVWKLLRKTALKTFWFWCLYDLFYDEDIRFKFIDAYRKFMRAIDNVFPRKEALDYVKDMFRFTELNVLAGSISEIHVWAWKAFLPSCEALQMNFWNHRGIEQKLSLFQLWTKTFRPCKTKQRTKTKAAEVEHAIRHFIDINITEDPELYASFAEALAEILREFKTTGTRFTAVWRNCVEKSWTGERANLWFAPQETNALVPHFQKGVLWW